MSHTLGNSCLLAVGGMFRRTEGDRPPVIIQYLRTKPPATWALSIRLVGERHFGGSMWNAYEGRDMSCAGQMRILVPHLCGGALSLHNTVPVGQVYLIPIMRSSSL